ncbi:MAG: hypothetical protein ACLGGV_04585 [Bacteroidia bacterium]
MKAAKINPAKTVLTITVGLITVALLTKNIGFLYAALSVGVIGVFSNYLSKKIDFLWMKLAWLLSLIVPKILLSVIFYFVLFPVSLLSKLFSKKDPLILKNTKNSTFIDVNKTFDKKSLENPW